MIDTPRMSPAPRDEIVRVEAVTKRFGSTVALRDVSLTGHAGTIHAVTGENGAGKSTLMKLLAGVHQPDSGTLYLKGTQIRLPDPSSALKTGISTVFQEFTLLPNLTIAENLHLGREPGRYGMLDRRRMKAHAREVLDQLEIAISPDRFCGELTVAEQQLVEIAKGISADASVFIFDEPTAALNKIEVDKLETLLRELRRRGKLLFYISHRLEEIFRFCDLVTVLKDGALVTTSDTAALDHHRLIALMVGRPLQDLFPPRATPETLGGRPEALRVEDLVPVAGMPSVSLSLHRGEIVGLAGLEGQGQREVLRSLVGITSPAEARITRRRASGDPVPYDPRNGVVACVDAGVGFVPEDRKSEGLYLTLPIDTNMSLGLLRGLGLAARAPRDQRRIAVIAEELQLRASSLEQLVGTLSGGNQQKVMLGRWLAAGVDTLIVEEPTRGVDVGAKAEIYRLLRDFADQGGAVLLVSSELTEIIGFCDRVLVMRAGAIVGEIPGHEATEENVMEYALKAGPRERASQGAV